MRVLVIWREDSEYGRAVREWLHDVERRTGRAPEEYNPDERDGESICRAYDIQRYPTVMALAEDGRVVQMWEGENLPTVNDISYYLIQL